MAAFIKDREKSYKRKSGDGKKVEKIKEAEKREDLPKAFVERMKEMLGAEYPDFLESYQKEAVRGLRVNLLKGTKEAFLKQNPFTLTPVRWEQTGFSYPSQEHPGKHPYHEAGVYYIQEPSAMAAAKLTDPKPGERILDLCAAPGGKATHLASMMEGKGLLITNEVHPARAKVLSQNIERMGIRNAVVTNEEPERLETYFPEFFDRIVVDAPCSGEGMFRKDDTARLEWSLQNVSLCAVRQEKILDCAAKMLRSGGRLVYSTCTFSPEENEGSMVRFLERHPEFTIDSEIDAEKYRRLGFLQGCPKWAGCTEEKVKQTFRLFPHKIEGEGHYIAVLCKVGKKEENLESSNRHRIMREIQKRKEKGQIADWEVFQAEMGFSLGKGVYSYFGNELYLMPEEMISIKGLKVLRVGLHLGTLKKNRFEPSHALALALSPLDIAADRVVSFRKDRKEIFSYLKGEEIVLEEERENGWNLVCVDGYSIGWGKVSQGKMKNHYPKGLRWM